MSKIRLVVALAVTCAGVASVAAGVSLVTHPVHVPLTTGEFMVILIAVAATASQLSGWSTRRSGREDRR